MSVDGGDRRLLWGTISLLVFGLAAIAYHHYFDATGAGFDRRGVELIVYHVARLGLIAYLMAACYGLGYWTLAGLRQPLPFHGLKAFISCFFLGASIYGLVFSLLGLASVLSFPLALVATAPFVLFLQQPLEILRGGIAMSALSALPRQAQEDVPAATRLGLVGILAVAIALFVVSRVLFIASPDGNVWEHYLHYYRSVLHTGSTQPGDVWHHFFNSKGGGLSFVGIFLGDLFSVQLVSTCFVLTAGAIIFDLLMDVCADMTWALLGVALYFSYFVGDVSDGGLFRVHAVILGYAAFSFWAWQQLPAASPDARRALLISFFISLAYAGFYQPVESAVLAPAFGIMWLGGLLVDDRRGGFALAVLCGAIVGAGTTVTIAINWLITGLPEITPMKTLWAIAQQDKAAHIFGMGGIDFFLAVNNDVTNTSSLFQRIYGAIRYLPMNSLTYLTIIAGGLLTVLVIAQAFAGRRPDRGAKFVLAVGLFMVPFVVLNVVFPSPSLYRMGLYSTIFVIFATIAVWHKAVRFLPVDWQINPLGLSSKREGRPIEASIKEVCVVGLIALMSLGTLYKAILSARPLASPIYRFASARSSLEQTMEQMESLNPRLVSGETEQAMAEFRRRSGYAGPVLGLVYDASYAYLLPGAGVVSEPTYAIVRDPGRLTLQPPGAVADYLRSKKIEYVALNLPSRLFTTFAFTSLFRPDQLGNYFDLAYEHGTFFIFHLRDNAQTQNPKPANRIPDYVLSILEMKQQGVLHFPFSDEFAEALRNSSETLITSSAEFDEIRIRFVDEMRAHMTKNMVDAVTLPDSKKVLRKIIDAAVTFLQGADAGQVLKRPRTFNGDLMVRMPESDARERMIDAVKIMLAKEYEARFGASLAALSVDCDERVPFLPSRPASARCQ